MTAADAAAARTAADAQVTLVSGTNIKTVNSTSLLGSGNITAGLSGTGAVDNAVLRADGTGGSTLQSSAIVIDDLYTASPNNTVNFTCLKPTGGTTNVGFAIVPKGTGAITLAVPDGTATSGNARGANAIDLQISRTVASQVASSTGAAIIGGERNTISGGSYSYICGSFSCSITSGNYCAIIGSSLSSLGASASSVIIGGSSNSMGVVNNSVILGGQFASGKWDNGVFYASGRWTTAGDMQAFQLTGAARTTTNTAVEVNWGLGVGNNPVYITLTAGRQISGTLIIQGIKSDGSVSSRYCRHVTIRRVSNTTTLDSSDAVGTDLVNGTSLTIAADNTNHRLAISPTGVAAQTWRWNARFDGIELAYGT
jgi:hypothetical protein